MKKYITVAALLVAGTAFANAATYVWTGAAGTTSWETSGNWDLNNGYYPQSSYDSAVIGEDAGTIVWSSAEQYFGATNEITVGKNSEVHCTLPNNSTGDFSFSVLNLYGKWTAEGTNALGFKNDFSLNFGDITSTEAGLFDLSGFEGVLWGNNHTVSVSASATVTGKGTLDLVKIGSIYSGYGPVFNTDNIQVTGSNGEALTLVENVTSLEALGEGEYAIVNSGASNGGVQILYSVPEPSAFGLIAGLGALALVASRRRRK